MNILALLPFAVLAIPIIPVFVELFRRKDKGPRKIPERTLNKEGSNIFAQTPSEDKPNVSDPDPSIERMRAKGRVKITGEIIRIVGDASIPNGLEIQNDIVAHGNLRLGSRCRINGSIKAFGEVDVGEESVVKGHIISRRKVTIRRNARVEGIVDSAEDIILEENTTVDTVSTEKSVKLAPNAKVNRRISAAVSTSTIRSLTPILEPATGSPSPKREEPQKVEGATQLTVEEKRGETSNGKNGLFKILQDRIKSLEPPKTQPTEESRLKALNPSELAIHKLATSGRDVYEIGLRLLMDPVEVQGVIDSLIKRGYLNENLRPVIHEDTEKVSEATISETKPLRIQREKKEKPELEELPIDEVFEKLLASKLHVEVKKKDGKESTMEAKDEADKSATKNGKENPSGDAVSSWQTKEDGKLSETRSQREASEGEDKSTDKEYFLASLPVLTLLSILLTEVAYYDSHVFFFLDQTLPLNFRMWMIFLGFAVILGLLSGVGILRYLKSKTGSTWKEVPL